MNVLENNRLILEFMGLEFEETMNGDKVVCIHDVEESECFFEEKDLRYYKSWDWLMTVVNHCTQKGFRDTDYDNDVYKIWEECFDDTGMFLGNHINNVYESCILFIKEYNKHK